MFYSKRLLEATYEPGTLVFEKNAAGTWTITVSSTGLYEVRLVGGGSGGGRFDAKYYGGWSNWKCAAGGSGGYLRGLLLMERDISYKVVVGDGGQIASPGGDKRGSAVRVGTEISGAGGNTYIQRVSTTVAKAGGGTGCQNAAYLGDDVKGKGGTNSYNSSYLQVVYSNVTGNDGGYGGKGIGSYYYGPSVYSGGNTGIGAGGKADADNDDHANAWAGNVGYIRITYTRPAY